MSAFVYILRCADGSYYVGSTRGESVDKRLGEHQSGSFGGYTSTRRPVDLVFAEHFIRITDAIDAERRIKGWSRAKKEALIRGDWDRVQWLAQRPGARMRTLPPHSDLTPQPHPEVPAKRASKDAPDHTCVLRGPATPATSA
jgi:putative endonuclease